MQLGSHSTEIGAQVCLTQRVYSLYHCELPTVAFKGLLLRRELTSI